ncbi:helix-turn-helix transcriptional regulator [Streptomyces sp. NPDC093094]|uniref:helix-turn-helix transcriptional regulator n=1 Tax=Streptomyces sp. NPDC093094 TaxID=3366026 RepID=UPI003808CF39
MPKTSARLLTLLSLLQTRRDWPGSLLADRLGISLRTVRRDVDRLRELGYSIDAVKGPDGGYRLGAGAGLPPLLFDNEQVLALTVALRIAASRPDDTLAEPAARALNTLRQVMPSRLRHRIDALQVTAVDPPATQPSAAVDGDVLSALSTAVHAREVLRFGYAPDAGGGGSGATGGSPRRVEPHHVVSWGGRWYLVAYDLDRQDWRTFRADRITPRTPTGPGFTRRNLPGGDVATHVVGSFRGSTDDSGDWPCRGTVVLDLDAAAVAPYLREGLVEELDDGRCRLTLGSWSWTGLASALARYDADIEVVGPPELTDAFARLGSRFLRTAAGSSATTP